MTTSRIPCPHCGNENAPEATDCVWCDRVLPHHGAAITQERPVRLRVYAMDDNTMLLEQPVSDGKRVHLGRGPKAGAIGRLLEGAGRFGDVSGNHAHFTVEGAIVEVTDESTYGTWVNRERLNGVKRDFRLPVEIWMASSCRVVVERTR